MPLHLLLPSDPSHPSWSGSQRHSGASDLALLPLEVVNLGELEIGGIDLEGARY